MILNWLKPAPGTLVEKLSKMSDAKALADELYLNTLTRLPSDEERADYGVIKEKIRADLKRYISKQTQKRPLIMPVILEI